MSKVKIKNFLEKNSKNYLILIICSFFFSFGTVILLSKAQTIPSGVSSIPQTLSYFFDFIKPYITLIFLGLNIPIILIFWNKVKRSFMCKTLFSLVCNAIFGLILGQQQVYDSILSIFQIGPEGVSNKEIANSWQGLIYGLLAILVNSLAAAFTWKNGASTGGTDIIAYYFSVKKKTEVGFFLRIIAVLMTTISITILLIGKKFEYIIGIQTIVSYLYIFLTTYIINYIFPKYKKVKIRIDSKKPDIILEHLKNIRFSHPYHVTKTKSGYTNEEVTGIESVILLFELKSLQNEILKVDPNAWIATTPVFAIKGNFDYSYFD
ncbi:MAG: YitT family protein [Metamycoplasmataceae bacterium]